MQWTGVLAGAALGLLLNDAALAQNQQLVTIGTGGVTGVYFPAGGAICRIVNQGRREHGVRCSVESTPGSVDNIRALQTGDLDFALVQSDVHADAWAGEGPDFPEPFTELRSVFALHAEPFALLARADTGIETLDDLKGKRVNVGNPGSGQRATFGRVLAAKNWALDVFALATELPSSQQSEALAEGRLDALAFVAGQPNASIQEATMAIPARLVPVEGPDIDRLVASAPYYSPAIIQGNLYADNPKDVPTFAVRATFVTSSRQPDDVVRTLVAAVVENFDEFRQLHPALEALEPADLLGEGLFAPLHPGAEAYYREIGLK
jgi:TRAP transporter TAXI family solute receptor